MRASLIIAVVSLVVSCAALFVAVRNSPTDPEIDRRVDAVLQQRERDYVHALTPKMDLIYRDMIRDYRPPEKPPETFAELFTPALQIVTSMSTR